MSALPKTVAQPDPARTMTVLQAKPGLRLTKTYTKDGVEAYDDAKFFQHHEVPVDGIRALHEKLTKLEPKPGCGYIRGRYVGDKIASGVEGAMSGPGFSVRKLKQAGVVLHEDVASHIFCADIDGYTPEGINPVQDPVGAINQLIERYLPACFQDVDYHWQLSSSAGMPGKEHLLKAHVWFWLKKAYTSRQLRLWVKASNLPIDTALYNPVQVHYTANPVFTDGVADPVPVRSGFYEGLMDSAVDLTIDEVLLLRAAQAADDESEGEIDLVDPREKPGVIGAFCRAFTIEEVLERWLPEEFSFQEDGNDRRVTWHNGGGTPGGAFVTEDRQHLVSKHNTDPLDNRATNKFDLVRHYVYGHLDAGLDQFELLDMSARPSYQAMCAMAEGLPEVKAELVAAKGEQQTASMSVRDQFVERIEGALSEADLRERVIPEIALAELQPMDITGLVAAVQKRMKQLTGISPRKEDIRPLLTARPARDVTTQGGVPGWVEDYCYVTSVDKFYRYNSSEWLTAQGFNARFNRAVGTTEVGVQLSAAAVALNDFGIPVVQHAMYLPGSPAIETNDGNKFGVSYVNTFRPDSVPAAKPRAEWTADDSRAVRMAQRHLELLCGERPTLVNGLIDWMAYCVQRPGVKINYTWLLVGGEGIGKTWISSLMAAAMGRANVRVVSPGEIRNPQFNAWAEGAAFCVCEEVRVPGHKHDVWDALKPVLTNDWISVVGKGKDGKNVYNVSNYLILSNHKDAVPIAEGSRRVGVIFSPFDGDKVADQLNAMAEREGYADSGAYFDRLFDDLREHEGAIREWLATWAISETFDPKGRAPESEERASLVHSSMSHEEQIIRDVISEGAFGVSDEIINAGALKLAVQLWEDGGFSWEESRAKTVLSKLGYRSTWPLQLKWEGKNLRVWTKLKLSSDPEEANRQLRAAYSRTEKTATRGADEDFLS